MKDYSDILYRPHPVSTRHAPMSQQNRAAQFAPFAALSGFEETIRETARTTESFPELAEGTVESLNHKLVCISQLLPHCPPVTFTCFCPDERKSGGHRVTVTGRVKKMELPEGILVLDSGKKLPIAWLLGIEADFLPG